MTTPRQRWPVLLAALCCAIYTAGALTTYPSLFPDPAYGLLVQKSARAGAPWNHVTEPLAADIARDDTYFHTMWSPGQHMLPGMLMSASLSLGSALRVIDVGAALVAIIGWYWLFRALGFSVFIAGAACLLVAMSRTFGFSFLAYVGSDQLAFAGFPYLALAAYALRSHWMLIVATPMLVIAGFFLKNSMMVYVGAWIAVVVAVTWLPAWRSTRAWVMTASIAVTGGAALWLIDRFYLSRGWTPVSYQPVWSGDASTYLLPAAMTVLAGTGIDDILSRLFDNPVLPKVDYKHSIALLAPIVLAILWWAIAELHRHERSVRVLILAFAATVAVAFTVLLATGSGASVYLSRHYVIPGTLLLPLILERLASARSMTARIAIAIVLAVPALYGVLSFGANWSRYYHGRASHSSIEVAHLTLTPRAIQHLRVLDQRAPEGSLVVLPGPDLSFEFSKTRILATSATSDGLPEFRQRRWGGRVPNLVVVAELGGQTPEEIEAWLASFGDYRQDGWSHVEAEGLGYYVPTGQAVTADWLSATLAETP